MRSVLNKEYYLSEDVVKLARDLIGKVIHTNIDGIITSAIITETEAYAGITDKASHAYGGRRTQRTEVMYFEGGTAYVYLCYGMHYLFNIVTNKKEIPHAILIRGIYPLIGIETMLQRANKNKLLKDIGKGPGKVTKLLGISKKNDGISLLDNIIWVTNDGIKFSKSSIVVSKRIGIDYAGEDALLPYRFYVEDEDVIKWIKKIELKK